MVISLRTYISRMKNDDLSGARPKRTICSCTGSGWPLSEISYKTEGGLLLAHISKIKFSTNNLLSMIQ